jgi:signal transduction histidine kinase
MSSRPTAPEPARETRAPGTIGLRLALWYAVIFAASVIVLAGLTYALLSSSLRQRDAQIVVSTLREYASRYATGGLPALARAVDLEERTGRQERLFVRVVGPGQQALFVSIPPEWGEFDVGGLPLGSAEAMARAPARDRDAVLEVASAELIDGTLLQVGKSTENRDDLLRRFRRVLSGVTVLVLIVGLAGGFALTRSTLVPIHELVGVVSGIIDTGRTDARVPTRPGGDAIDELSAQFNKMLDRITSLVEAMRGSLDNVAHDLRTPMARLRGIAERALGSSDPALQREALATCIEESDRIIGMLDTLMDISEAETGTLRLNAQDVPLGALLQEVVSLYEDVADEKQVVVTTNVHGADVLRTDPDRLRQALANLLDNALKYTGAGGRVELKAFREGPGTRIAVSDTGIGIPAEDLPRIWDRLYRGDRSRTERGLGLGLSLVRAYVRALGGTVVVESEPGRGSTFTVLLPDRPA